MGGKNTETQSLDYERLRLLLSKQFGRHVDMVEAKATGDHLIGIYEVIAIDHSQNDTITPDTTYR